MPGVVSRRNFKLAARFPGEQHPLLLSFGSGHHTSTEAGTYGLLRKQLESLNCPVWSETHTMGRFMNPKWHYKGGPTLARVYCYCSDGGPDQVLYKKVRQSHFAAQKIVNENEIFTPCLLHSNQLIYKGGLIVVDRWLEDYGACFRYFAALAKLVHLRRELCRRVFLIWVRLFGAVEGI